MLIGGAILMTLFAGCGEEVQPEAPEPALVTRSAPVFAAGEGLTAVVSNGVDAVERVDPEVNIPYFVDAARYRDVMGTGLAFQPTLGVVATWSGQILADTAETFTFHLDTADGVVLTVDSTTVIDSQTDETPRTVTGSIALTAGWHDVTLSLTSARYSYSFGAVLEWSSPSIAQTLVPRSNLRVSGDSADLTAPAILGITDINVFSSEAIVRVATDELTTVLVDYGPTAAYGSTANHLGFGTDHVVTVTGLTPGTYHYQVTATDSNGNVTTSVDRTFTTGAARSRQDLGLFATYETISDTLNRIDLNIDYPLHDRATYDDYYGAGLDPPMDQYRTTRTGLIHAEVGGLYQFTLDSDDAGMLEVDGRLLTYDWEQRGLRSRTNSLYLQPGWYPIRVVNVNDRYSGETAVVLKWTPPGGSEEVIPPQHFMPGAQATDTTAPTVVGLAASRIDANVATIGIETGEVSRATVEYGLTTAYGSSVSGSHVALVHYLDMTGLSADTTYHYRLIATDLAGNTTTSSDQVLQTRPSPMTAADSGITGTYKWNGATVVRIDQSVDFPEHDGTNRNGYRFYGTDMGNSSYSFTASWAGLLRVDTPELYTFFLDVDDAGKLLIDGQLVFFEWRTGPTVTLTGSIELEPGWHRIEVFSFKARYNATLGTVLRWSSPSIAEEVIPIDHLSPAGAPADSAAPTLTASPVRMAGTSVLIGTSTDEPARIVVEWGPGLASRTEGGSIDARHTVELTPTVPGTTYDYRVIATDLAGNASSVAGQFVAEAMSSSPRNGGMLCTYRSNRGTRIRIDSDIDFPVHGPLDNDNYLNTHLYSRGELTMYCEGLIRVDQSEEITFSFRSEDGALMTIDDRSVFYDWTYPGERTNEGTMFLTAGWHSVRLRMFHDWDTSIVASLKWRSATISEEVIPEDHFAPAALPGDTTAPTIDFAGIGLVMDTAAMLRVGTDEPTLAYIEWGTTTALGNSATNGFGDVEHAINLPTLPDGQEIFYRAAVHDMAGNWTRGDISSFTTRTEPLSPGYGGLHGHYWSHFSPWDLERIDQNIDFPLHGLDQNNDLMGTGLPLNYDFDVNWNGLIYAPASDTYTFYTTAADGMSVEIDHRPVLLDWVSMGISTAEGSIYMAEGWHIIHARAFGDHLTNQAMFQLRWSSSTIAEEVVPPESFAPWGDPRDTTPPVIIRQFLSAAQPTSITVQAEANELSRMVVEYGTTLPYEFSATYDKILEHHAVTLFGLDPSTEYHYRVVLTDLAGNVTYGTDRTTVMFSESSPEILGGANATYTTAYGSLSRVDPQIDFPSHAPTANGFYESGLAMSSNRISTEHVGLVLVDDTGYYTLRTDSDDGAVLFVDDRMLINSWSDGGRRTTERVTYFTAGWHHFTLKSFNSRNSTTAGIVLSIAPDGGEFAVVEQNHLIEDELPGILALEVSDITHSSARVTLEANEEVAAILRYGQSSAYGSHVESSVPDTDHVFDLTGLQPDTLYHYAVLIRDSNGNVASSTDLTFRTTANETELTCQSGTVYDGPTHSGLLPAVFAGDEIPICFADAGGANIINRFRLNLVSSSLGINDVLIDTAYAPARSLAWPGCVNPDWCAVDGSQNIDIHDLIPAGDYQLRYIVNDTAGGVTQANYDFSVVNLPVAIARVMGAVQLYAADGTITEADDRARADLSDDVYSHALAAYDAELWGTVIASIAAMKNELMAVRANLDPVGHAGARDELARLLTELNTSTVHFIRAHVGSSDSDGHIVRQLDRAWSTRDVVASAENAADTAYWAMMRDNVLQNPDATAIELRIAAGHQARLDDALALGLALEAAVDDMYQAALADDRLFGTAELANLATATEALAISLDDYVNLRMSNQEIATLVRDVFVLVSYLRDAQDEYLGISDLEYFAALTIYAIVEVALPNATNNVCLGIAHPLLREAHRRWDYLAVELQEYQSDLDQARMASFVTAVLAPHAFWSSVGEVPENANAAFPDVPCFVAAVYNAAYTTDGDALYYDSPVLDLPACPDTAYDYASCL